MKRYEKCFRPLRFTAPTAGWLIIHLPRRRLQGKDALFFTTAEPPSSLD